MKRASGIVSLVAVAFLPACVLEVQDEPEGGWNGPRGGEWGGTAGTGSTSTGGSGRRDASAPDTRRARDGGSRTDAPRTPPPPDAAPEPPEPPEVDAGYPPPSEEMVCRHDQQCQGGRCVAGACQRPCTTDEPCGTGQVCTGGFCQGSPQPGGQCVYASDCGSDATCVNGFCHERCGEDGDCSSSADRCDRGLCRPDVRPIPQCTGNAQCPADRTCVDAVCRNPCRDDSQCGPGCSGTVCSGGYCFMPEELTPPTCPPMPPTCGTPTGCGPTCRQ